MTSEAGSSQPDATAIPKHILDNLTLHVSLEKNGKLIFMRRLVRSFEPKEKAIQFLSRELTGMVRLDSQSLAIYANWRSDNPDSNKSDTPSKAGLS